MDAHRPNNPPTKSEHCVHVQRLGIVAALVSMVLVHPAIGDIPGATLTQVTNLNPPSYPRSLAAASDGKIWFSEGTTSSVGYFTPDGKVTRFPVPCAQCGPAGHVSVIESIAIGSDGNVWFPYSGFNADLTPINGGMNSFIGRFTPAGAFAQYSIPTQQAFRQDFFSFSSIGHSVITSGPDGNLWFTENWVGKVGKITIAGVVTEYPLPSASASPSGITTGPDGNLWFAETAAGKIGRISPGGTLAEFLVPGGIRHPAPFAITAGPDSKLWFTDQSNGVDSITTTGTATRYNIEPDSQSTATQPSGIAVGPDGKLYFPYYFISGPAGNFQGKIGQFDPATATSVTSDLPNMVFGNEIVSSPTRPIAKTVDTAVVPIYISASQSDGQNVKEIAPFVLQVGAPPCVPPITIPTAIPGIKTSTFPADLTARASILLSVVGAVYPITVGLSGDVPVSWSATASPADTVTVKGPLDEPRTYTFTVTVIDARGCSAQVTITLKIYLPRRRAVEP